MRRDIAVSIILSIVTCGIYSIYWMIKLNDEINAAVGDQAAQTGGVVFLLTLVTCGIYGLYWLYKMGEKVDAIKIRAGQPAGSSAVLYLLFGFLGLSIVSYALMQDTINNYVLPSQP